MPFDDTAADLALCEALDDAEALRMAQELVQACTQHNRRISYNQRMLAVRAFVEGNR
jgi:hypothetical protein